MEKEMVLARDDPIVVDKILGGGFISFKFLPLLG